MIGAVPNRRNLQNRRVATNIREVKCRHRLHMNAMKERLLCLREKLLIMKARCRLLGRKRIMKLQNRMKNVRNGVAGNFLLLLRPNTKNKS